MNIDKIINWLKMKEIIYKIIIKRDCIIDGFSSLANYKQDSMTWIKSSKNYKNQNISLAIIQESEEVDLTNINIAIYSNESKKIFFGLIEDMFNNNLYINGIGKNTIVGEKVVLPQRFRIGNNCSIVGNIVLGENSVIGDNVVIKGNVKIGQSSVINSNTTIGEDGFAYTETTSKEKNMVKHYGGVSIGDNVSIGANCVIAKGTIDDTIIKDGCKIDALCHIAHNCILEKNAVCIAGTILYGSSLLEENSYVATGIIRNQCVIGKNSIVGMGAVVVKNVPPNVTVVGNPAKEFVK